MDGGTAVTLFLNGLALAAILFLLASGLTLIFGLLDFVNFAHGSFFLVGAYVFTAVAAKGGSIVLGFAAAIVGGAAGGLVLERVLLRRAYGNELHQFLLTLGLGLIITEVVRIIAGPNFKALGELEVLGGNVSILGGSVQAYRLFLIALGVAVFAAMLYVLRRTRIGLIVRGAWRTRAWSRCWARTWRAASRSCSRSGRRWRCSPARPRRPTTAGATRRGAWRRSSTA
jgi:branched-chain amino acid transport system permease protein